MSLRLLLICCVLLFADLVHAQTLATPVREVDAVCAQCHEAIFENYLKTPMANASGMAAEQVTPGSFHHRASGVDYTVVGGATGPTLTYRLPGNPPVQNSVILDYFLGSGHLGVTYLYSIDGYLFESPIAYYRRLSGYDMKPGLENSPQMPDSLTLNDGCLRCHMSAAQKPEADTDNHYRGLPFLHTGITCESCHGDTRQHVLTRGKAAVVDPLKLSAEKRDSTCIVCHLEGDSNVERRNKSALDYRPGDDVRDYLSYFAYASENTTRRAVSEIEQFDSSKCKRMSGAAMSCMNCHDPHFAPTLEERAAFYRNKCLACHTGAQFALHHHAENPDCTSCHMPKTGAQNVPHVAWTDHRILKAPDEAPEAAMVGHEEELEPILASRNDIDAGRDLGLAYYNLLVKGEAAPKDRAWELLTAANQSNPGDSAVERALGVLAEMNAKDATAEGFYRAVVKGDPNDLTANTNLGTLLAKSGDLRGAEAIWRPTFERNQDNVGLGTNLAIAQCMLGEKAQSVETLRTILKYSPDLREVRTRLHAIEAGEQACSAN